MTGPQIDSLARAILSALEDYELRIHYELKSGDSGYEDKPVAYRIVKRKE